MAIPLSMLDLSPVSSGSTAAQALRNSVELAKAAEAEGYRRYWFAEHHFAAVASTSPDVLAGQVLAATERINVGSAAVLLGYCPAVLAVERFAILAALYPDRVDFGVGRSAQRREELADAPEESADAPRDPDSWPWVDGVLIPEFPSPQSAGAAARAARAARDRQLFLPQAQPPDYGQQVDEILALVAGTRTTSEGFPVRIASAEGSGLVPWVFGSSRGQSVAVAGSRGLPFVSSYHVTPATAVDAVAAYREAFAPSSALSEPYVAVSADVVVAETDEKAQELAHGYGRWVHSIRANGAAEPYAAPGEGAALSGEERALVEDRLRTRFVGSSQTVVERLRALAKLTLADEVVVTTITHDFADRARSQELLAEGWKAAFGGVNRRCARHE